jgi:hypothetical protein
MLDAFLVSVAMTIAAWLTAMGAIVNPAEWYNVPAALSVGSVVWGLAFVVSVAMRRGDGGGD